MYPTEVESLFTHIVLLIFLAVGGSVFSVFFLWDNYRHQYHKTIVNVSLILGILSLFLTLGFWHLTNPFPEYYRGFYSENAFERYQASLPVLAQTFALISFGLTIGLLIIGIWGLYRIHKYETNIVKSTILQTPDLPINKTMAQDMLGEKQG